MRNATVNRKTRETDIQLSLALDGSGKASIQTGCGFFDHMLTLFAVHGGFDLSVTCCGDTEVDYHHSVEDIGIALGKAFCEALGDKKGICRYGNMLLPMDEALVLSAVDISGRGMLPIPAERVGDFDTELCEEFFTAYAANAGVTLHIRKEAGRNSHHIMEGAFKSAARALRAAAAIDPNGNGKIPSTKGVL